MPLSFMPHTGRTQFGFSLVELLISITLGLFIILIITGLISAGKINFFTQADTAILHDSARTTFTNIARSVRQAGFTNQDIDGTSAMTDATLSADIIGFDHKTLKAGSPGISSLLENKENFSDVLAVRFSGSGKKQSNGVTAPDNSILNCAGFGVTVPDTTTDLTESDNTKNNEEKRSWSIYYVARGAGGESELFCKYRGKNAWSATAIAQGVDSFQVLYRLENDDHHNTGKGNQGDSKLTSISPFLSAGAIHALDATILLNGVTAAERTKELNQKTYWKKVTAIKVALLLHSTHTLTSAPAAQQFDLFGAGYRLAHGDTDPGTTIDTAQNPVQRQQLRHAFSTIIQRRNTSVRYD